MEKVSSFIDKSFPNGESVDRLAKSAHAAIDRVAESAKPAMDKAHSAAAGAAASVEAKAGALGELEKQWMDSAREHVRQNPLTSIALAVAAGMLLARLTSHR
jgi:ElaB/YqjD/DUF883 family membrane-anchored ribosome-binding protein